MQLTENDWKVLEDLRGVFLSEKPSSSSPYWTEKNLSLYDLTFGRRILWKWEAVLTELTTLGFSPANTTSVLDWGCGTGVATEAFLKFFPQVGSLQLSDYSPKAESFAAQKIKKQYPSIDLSHNSLPEIVLLSHVANELSSKSWNTLLEMLQKARTILWVEPGTPAVSHKLIEAREELKKNFHVIAPCFHQKSCGMTSGENKTNWCHFLAPVPQTVFHDSFYSEFSRRLGIDLRSLPVSYLVLSKDFQSRRTGGRIIAGSRFYKGYAQAIVCNEKSVSEVKLMERNQSELISKIKQRPFCQPLAEQP